MQSDDALKSSKNRSALYLDALVLFLLHTQATAHIDSRDTLIYEVNLANEHGLGVTNTEDGMDA